MTITAAFCPLSLQALLDANGVPIAGGRVTAYDAGTTSPRPVYQDAGLTTAHPSPVLTDAYGRIPPIWVGVGAYKLVIQDANGAQLSVVDNLPGGTDDSGSTAVVGTVIPTGFVMAAHTDETFDGWLPLNAKSIGPASSSATARANADVQALYIKLWNKDASLAVQGGRGVSATADWNAAKTLALPDYRGRTLVGVDAMGSSLAGVITAATTATPNVIGTALGAEKTTLSVAQLPAFTPTVTVNAAGGHAHTATAAAVSDHTHTGTTSTIGNHQHNIQNANLSVSTGGGPAGLIVGGSGAFSTEPGGTHYHTFTSDLAGGHTHGVTVAAVADHTHTASAASIGGGAAHQNMPPSVACFWHIKL